MLRKFTALAAIAALVGSLTFSTAVDARGFHGGGGWHGGGWHGGGWHGGGWHGGYRGYGYRGYYGRGWGYGPGWGYGGYYGGACWSWWYGRWVWVC